MTEQWGALSEWRKKTKKIFSVCAVFFLLIGWWPKMAEAQITLRSGQGVSLAKEQIVNGNFYASSDAITISGEISGDASLVAYRSVTLNGSVSRDVLIAAAEVRIFGGVGEDARILAGDVVIADRIEGDVLVIGGTLEILSTASVGGDVLFYGGNLTVAGTVDGTIIGRMQSVRIDGPVGGDVLVRSDQVTLGDRARVEGLVQYTSRQQLQRAANATAGEVRRLEPAAPLTQVSPQTVAIPLLISLFSVLLWHLAHRRSLQAVMQASVLRPAQAVFIGFGTLFFAPPVFVLVMVTLIGLLVGAGLLFAWLALVVATIVVAGPVIGAWLARVAGYGAGWNPVWHLVIGTLALHALRFVPIVGSLVVLIVVFLSAGVLARLLYRQYSAAPAPAETVE